MSVSDGRSPPLTPEAVIRAAAAAAGAWGHGAWPDQDGLIARIAATSGYSPQVVSAGITAHLAALTESELRRWFGKTPPAGEGVREVAVIPAANIPGVAIVPLLAALLAGSRVFVKTSPEEPHLIPAWHERLAAADPDVGARIEVLEWTGGDDASVASRRGTSRLAEADRIVVLGSDATIAGLAGVHGDRVVGLGTGASIAVVGAGTDMTRAAVRLARDVALWDQQGCLSPQGVVVIGPRSRADALTDELGAALAALEVNLPAGGMKLMEAAAARRFRAELDARQLGGETIRRHESTVSRSGRTPARWLVWSDDGVTFEVAPARRHVWVRRVASIDELTVGALLPPRPHRQAVGLDPSDPERSALTAALTAAGVPYIAVLGSMQAPPVDWPNKGRDLLAELMGS